MNRAVNPSNAIKMPGIPVTRASEKKGCQGSQRSHSVKETMADFI